MDTRFRGYERVERLYDFMTIAKASRQPLPKGRLRLQKIKKHLQNSGVGIRVYKCHICGVATNDNQANGQSRPFGRDGHRKFHVRNLSIECLFPSPSRYCQLPFQMFSGPATIDSFNLFKDEYMRPLSTLSH